MKPPSSSPTGHSQKQTNLLSFFSPKDKSLPQGDPTSSTPPSSSTATTMPVSASSSSPSSSSPSCSPAAPPEVLLPLGTHLKRRDPATEDGRNARYQDGRIVSAYEASTDTYGVQWWRTNVTGGSNTTTTTERVAAADVRWYVLCHGALGQAVHKEFDLEESAILTNKKRGKRSRTRLFRGTVVHVSDREGRGPDERLYCIVYEDDDCEEMDEEEFLMCRDSSADSGHGEEDDHHHGDDHDDNDDNSHDYFDDDDDDVPPAKKSTRKRRTRRPAGRDKPQPTAAADDDEAETAATQTKKRKTTQPRVSEESSSHHDDDDDDEPPQAAVDGSNNKTRSSPRRRTRKRPVYTIDDSDDDADDHGDDQDFAMIDAIDEDDDDDALLADSSEEDEPAPSRRKSQAIAATRRQPKATKRGVTKEQDDSNATDTKKSKTSATPTAAAGGGGIETYDEEFQTKYKKDYKSFDPKNGPQEWPKTGSYVDPVGVDPTHGIVEGIVSAQVRKIGALLQQVAVKESSSSKSYDDDTELSYPIRLQTACSGTDAPSIALGLIKESLDKLVPDGRSLFEYTHEMSCEIEPFKQAYIGRNFPGVPLFPDITKLTESETVLDVYGRRQTIPDGNLFVAGTSCKDFSMLKTTYRIDIEDKGTSGETFLAAVEFLEVKKPAVAIFENVINAPWNKMQEYITGRLDLGNRNDKKGITDCKKPDADKDLKFSVNANGQYVAEEIPRQVGIRAGSIVEGFVRKGDRATNVRPLVSAEPGNTRLVSLAELARKHKINLEADTLVMEKKVRYCTHLAKVDTKDFGLAQTRQRKYLFIWKSDNPEDDLGKYWEEILDHLKTPLLHSMDAFLLPDTHDRIRCFREALRSGPGLMVKRERAKEPDFWDWNLSRVKDLVQHLVFRNKQGIAERMRWLTGWDTRGRKQLAPGLWPELFDCWNHRRLDMVDCFASAAIRDGISRDPLHHSFTWDLSQNVTRAPYRTGTTGVCGCVTPGGELLLPHRGRTVMGYEKLLLQGIPFSRLLLGPETEVQLSDLAGNAMSVPVVCATMLSAMCAPQLRHERTKNRKCLLADFALAQKYDQSGGGVLAERGDLYNVERPTDAIDFVAKLGDKSLATRAFHSSVLCTCESSGTMSKSEILHCVQCGMFLCHECSSRYQVKNHVLKKIKETANGKRPDPHDFEQELRCALPSTLRLGPDWEGILKHGHGLESYSFLLQEVVRKKGHWQLLYGAWEDHGRGRQVAEIRVLLGQTKTLCGDFGAALFIRCYAPAIRHDKPLRGRLKDSARLLLKSGTTPRWEIPAGKTTCFLSLVGSDPVASQRIIAGINDTAAKSLKDARKKPPGESRNPLTHYHREWKKWPGTIDVSGDPSNRVNGSYRKMTCTHTVVLSALWRREATDLCPAMYLYIRPDVLRTKLDVAVFSPTPSYADGLEICELHDWIPENTWAEKTQSTKATFLEWKEAPESMFIEEPSPSMKCVGLEWPESTSGSSVLCEMNGLSRETVDSLLEYNGKVGDQDLIDLDLFGRAGTRNAKRLSIVAAPSLLKYAAQGSLPLSLSKWYKLPDSIHFGKCIVNVPPRPVEIWQQRSNRDGSYERVYDPEESNKYYHRLFARPNGFNVAVDRAHGKLVIQMNPDVAAHRAAAQLGGETTGSVSVEYCLSELSSMGEPPTRNFHVPNSDAYDPAQVQGLVLPLYSRQAKALSRMQSIERGEVPFSEEERSEIVLPGIGWCLIAKASKHSPLRGGVLGDAIGSGKTVVTIALILAGTEKARASRDIEKGRSGATLIVVPPGLVRQWDDERKKFTKNALKSIIIDSAATLKKYSVKDLCEADMVIVPAGLIEEAGKQKASRPYTELLSAKAGAISIPPAPKGYSQREAPTIEGTWVRNMSSGPEIYVGNRGNQRLRDAQAYYGHCYAQAISKLRQKSFSGSDRGVPIEYFTWERVVIDECHETLVTGKKHETSDADFKENSRRGAREFLGVAETTPANRPLRAATGVWGLTGTPLLETEARVTELANLMGGTYLTGAAHHWRREERESGRDLFLNSQEAVRSREYRCAVQESCHAYVREACQRNRGEKLHVTMHREKKEVRMSPDEGREFLQATADVGQGFAIKPDQLGEKAADILSLTASSSARHAALLETILSILQAEPDTKIVIFSNTSFGGYASAVKALDSGGLQFYKVSDDDSVARQNEILSYFRHEDVTAEEKNRHRILLLSFEQAAGHNLQEACHHVILYDPYYSGSDAVADASVEEQAVGRVMRQGQKSDVTVTRIILKGPKGETCLDDWIVERNLDEDVLAAATSNFD